MKKNKFGILLISAFLFVFIYVISLSIKLPFTSKQKDEEITKESPEKEKNSEEIKQKIVEKYTDAEGNLTGLYGPEDTVTRAAAHKMVVCNHLGLPMLAGRTRHDDRLSWYVAYNIHKGNLSLEDLKKIAEFSKEFMGVHKLQPQKDQALSIQKVFEGAVKKRFEEDDQFIQMAQVCNYENLSCGSYDTFSSFVTSIISAKEKNKSCKEKKNETK